MCFISPVGCGNNKKLPAMKTLTASDRSALIRLASSLPKGSEERKAILNVLASRGNPVPASFRRKVDALARAIFEKTRHLSHVPQEIIDMELERLKPGTFIRDDVMEYLWVLAQGETLHIEGYGNQPLPGHGVGGKMDWKWLQGPYFRQELQGSAWGTKFWEKFLQEAKRKL